MPRGAGMPPASGHGALRSHPGRTLPPPADGLHSIDGDVHPTVLDIKALFPYLDEVWRESIETRGILSLESTSYPPNAPITARPDWRGASGQAATGVAEIGRQV